MRYRNLILVIEDRLATVCMNRPGQRNALSSLLMRELMDCAHQLAERTDVDAVVLHGSAPCFSAGADLVDAQAWADAGLSTVERRQLAGLGYRLCQSWEALPQITIAAIEGHAVGGGLALALACDWRVMAEDAFVSLPEVALGMPLTWGTIPRLVNLVGPAKAKRLTVLCERTGAADALAMGLIDARVPAQQALAGAQAMARQSLAMPAAAVRMSKESINACANALNHLGAHMAQDQIALAAASPESRAARAAVLRRG